MTECSVSEFCNCRGVYHAGARNQWGFEIVPAPKIPWPFWPLAIVGALLFAWCVDRAVER